MKLLSFLAFTLPLAAQLQVVYVPVSGPTDVGPSLNLGSVAVRDSSEFRFRAINGGLTPLSLQTLSVGGAGFSLGAPFVPATLSPGQIHDFSVRFSPAAEGSYSAILTVNSFTTLLRATAAPGPTLFLTTGGQTAELTAPSLQMNVVAGQTLTLNFAVGNAYTSPLALQEISVAGAGFSLASPPSTPLSVPPGTTVPIPVVFRADATGDFEGLLTTGPRRFRILASVFRPQLQAPRILTSEAVPRNGQQLKIRLQLAEPALAAGSGTLRAVFNGEVDDPAIVFPNGAREVSFQVAAGSRDATFEDLPETVIQTGTTAGALRLEAITESGITTETFRFERGLVTVEEAVARRAGSTLEVEILGFDNTRGVGSLNFRFFDRSGAALGGVISTAPVEQFKAHFEQSKLGGVFRLRAAFPVTGDATIVGSVLVEIANAVGRTDLQRLTFP